MSKYILMSLMGLMSAVCFSDSLHFTLHGDLDEWVSQGQDWDILYTTQNTNTLFAGLGDSHGVGPDSLGLYAVPIDLSSTGFLLAQFGTNQLGTPLVAGTYVNAERAPFASSGHPGLDVSFDGRGNNVLTGSFTIHSINFHPDNGNWVLDNFDASFQQFNEGGPLSCWGTITYQATPEPAPVLALLGLAPMGLLCRRRHQA